MTPGIVILVVAWVVLCVSAFAVRTTPADRSPSRRRIAVVGIGASAAAVVFLCFVAFGFPLGGLVGFAAVMVGLLIGRFIGDSFRPS